MRYIKIFEEYNIQLYKVVDRDDYLNGESVPFSKKIVDSIKEFCKLNKMDIEIPKYDVVFRILIESYVPDLEGGFNLTSTLYITEDDWIMVEMSGRWDRIYYKCDAIEGLMALLNKIYFDTDES